MKKIIGGWSQPYILSEDTHVFCLDDLKKNSDLIQQSKRFGAKTANLVNLSIHGILVPDGFATDRDVFDRFVNENPKLKIRIDKIEASALEFLSRRAASSEDTLEAELQIFLGNLQKDLDVIKRLIKEIPFDETVVEDLKRAYENLCKRLDRDCVPLIARSSAGNEDLEKNSFAGRYESAINLVNTEQLIDGMKLCYASLFDIGAVRYLMRLRLAGREETGVKLQLNEQSMSVLMLDLIDTYSSGCMFVAKSASEEYKVSVHSDYGLEGVVRGVGAPDRLMYEGDRCIIQRIGEKKFRRIANPSGGVEDVPVADIESSVLSLSRATATQMKEIATKVHDIYGKPMDMEFAVYRETGAVTVYYVQARPLSVSMGADQVEIVDEEYMYDPIQLDGFPVVAKVHTGRLRIMSKSKSRGDVNVGDVIVIKAAVNSDEDLLLGAAGAVITECGDQASHVALVLGETEKSSLVGATDAISILEEFDGEIVTLDPINQVVYLGARKSKSVERRSLTTNFVRENDYSEYIKAWDATSISTTTRVIDNKKYMSKPDSPVKGLELAICSRCLDLVCGREKDVNLPYIISEGRIFVDFKELYNTYQGFADKWTLSDFISFLERWRETGNNYLTACESVTNSKLSFNNYVDEAIKYNSFMGIAFTLYQALENKLYNYCKEHKIDRNIVLDMRKKIVRGLESKTREKNTAKREVMILLKSDASEAEKEAALKNYALSFKHDRDENFTMKPEEVIETVRGELEKSSIPQAIPKLKIESIMFYPDDEVLNTLVRLATELSHERQNYHHIKMCGQWKAREKIVMMAKKHDISEADLWALSVDELESIFDIPQE